MYEYQKTMEFKTRFISREDRRIARQLLVGKHGYKTKVKLGAEYLSVSLSDFSSLGFAITLDQSYAADFSVGEVIDIVVSPLIDHYYPVKGVIIDSQKVKQNEIKISAVIEHEQSCRHGNYQPIHLTPEQSLKGEIVHPFIYKQTTYFELESLSKKGFYATNINSDFTLFEGMEVAFSLAGIEGLQNVIGVVSNVGLTSDNHIRCFVEIPSLSRTAADQLFRHCFHFAQKTPKDIRESGLNSESIQELVQYRFVETQAEYEAVLKLRRKAYASEGLCKKDDAIAAFALPQDAYGRILIVFHNARVIATALLVFAEEESQLFEMEACLSDTEMKKLPKYSEIMEITAIFIERYYQDTDVLHGIFESMYREGLSAGKNHVVVGSEAELQSRYSQIGFSESEISYPHPRDPRKNMRVMVLDKDTGKTGKGMNPVRWWQVWGHVSMHLYQRRIIEYTEIQRTRVYINRFVFRVVEAYKKIFLKSA